MGARPETRRPLTADERELLHVLVRRCGPRLLGYVRRTFGPRIDAEEVVAESFCRAAANIETLRGCERHDLYLLTIARNLCRDHLRRRANADPEEPLCDHDAGVPTPAETVDQDERRQALLAAVARLPESQREVVTLRLSGTLKFEEIAELLDVPLGTVLSRMHAAVQKLRRNLDGEYGH